MTESTSTNNTSTNGSIQQELEETIARISANKGVEAVLILNRNGDILLSSGGASGGDSTTKDNNSQQAKYLKQLSTTATHLIRALGDDPTDTVSLVQVRSKQHEVMITPHNDYLLAVMRDPLAATLSSATSSS